MYAEWSSLSSGPSTNYTMLLWNFRDKNKAKDSARGKGGTSPGDETKRTGGANSAPIAVGPLSARSKRASIHLSPRPTPQHVQKPRGMTGSLRLNNPVAKEGEVVYATDDSGTTYIRQAKIDYIIE